MADTKTDRMLPKRDIDVSLHQSTLIASPRLSIPMPSGAKPPPVQTTQKPAGEAPKPGK